MRVVLASLLLATLGACGEDADADGDGFEGKVDCDDADASVHPGATDACDGRDEDCNGVADDGPDAGTWYRDDDGDGFGTDADSVRACVAPDGYAAAGGDCDDTTAAAAPGAPEVCDDLDNDCDQVVDGPGSAGWAWRWFDGDEDGFGDPAEAVEGCEAPGSGWVEDDQDCDDDDAAVNPDADEVCGDGVDNDCDTAIDDGSAADARTWYEDADGDGFGDAATAVPSCAPPPGPWIQDGTDCDDGDAAASPAGVEACNGFDDDCDLLVDDADPDAETLTWYLDADADGRGDPGASVQACSAPGGAVSLAGDCDDTDPGVHLGAVEICDGSTDEDCDALVDDLDPSVDPASGFTSWPDVDEDGFGRVDSARTACVVPAGDALVGGDCLDTDPAVNPGAQEVCFGVDEDCDGLLGAADDSVDPTGLVDAWTDADADGSGDAAAHVDVCALSPGLADDPDDCDDADPLIQGPGAWLDDGDGDGVGDGAPLPGAPSCTPPGPDTAPEGRGLDCAPSDASVFPGADDLCGDGIDQDCSGTDRPCAASGSFLVEEGPDWTGDPPVYSCIEACALVFGGAATDWSCSTSQTVLDHQAYATGYGDSTYCATPLDEAYSLEPAGDPGYNCGVNGCSYSAYTRDNCYDTRNWCWAN